MSPSNPGTAALFPSPPAMQVLVSSFKFLIPQTSFGGQGPAEQLPGMGHPWGTFQPGTISVLRVFVPVAVRQSQWAGSKSQVWQGVWQTGIWGCSLCSSTGRKRFQKATGEGVDFAQNSPALRVESTRKGIGTVWLGKIDLQRHFVPFSVCLKHKHPAKIKVWLRTSQSWTQGPSTCKGV